MIDSASLVLSAGGLAAAGAPGYQNLVDVIQKFTTSTAADPAGIREFHAHLQLRVARGVGGDPVCRINYYPLVGQASKKK